jgi:hypothetical protein
VISYTFLIAVLFVASSVPFFAFAPTRLQAQQPPPKVGADFQPAVKQLAGAGLKLREAVEASLDGTGKQLAAIFERVSQDPSQRYEFRIFESDGKTAKTVFRRSDFFFSFSETAQLNGTDINGDGLKEIIVQSSSGGNCWGCNPTEIYRLSNHKVELIALGPIQKIADLDGDGIVELMLTDARWESYDDFSHASSPGAVMVYAWKGGKYVYASRDYPAFYKGEVAQYRSVIEEAKAQITADALSDEGYMGGALSLAITYAHAGELERGLRELEIILRANVKSPAQAKHRATVLQDFRTGVSGKKLRELKYGDPLPLT